MCDVIRARTPTVGLSVKSPSYRGNPLALSLDTLKFERSQNKKIQRHDTLSCVCYHKRFANAKKYRNVDEYVTNKLHKLDMGINSTILIDSFHRGKWGYGRRCPQFWHMIEKGTLSLKWSTYHALLVDKRHLFMRVKTWLSQRQKADALSICKLLWSWNSIRPR